MQHENEQREWTSERRGVPTASFSSASSSLRPCRRYPAPPTSTPPHVAPSRPKPCDRALVVASLKFACNSSGRPFSSLSPSLRPANAARSIPGSPIPIRSRRPVSERSLASRSDVSNARTSRTSRSRAFWSSERLSTRVPVRVGWEEEEERAAPFAVDDESDP